MTVLYPIVLTSDIGRVRLLIPDRSLDLFVFQDEEIEAFLEIEGGVKLAAALALETIASDIAMVDKVIRIMDLQTDGAKTSDALLARAKLLREQAYDADATLYGVVEFDDLTIFNNTEYRQKRGGYW
jgi:hypothetical protein